MTVKPKKASFREDPVIVLNRCHVGTRFKAALSISSAAVDKT
jgi:hypothetical protein